MIRHCHKYRLINVIKMTREILEIVDDKINTNRILLMTKLTKRIPRVTKFARPYFHDLSLSQIDVIIESVSIQEDNCVSDCWATVDIGRSLSLSTYKGQRVPGYTVKGYWAPIHADLYLLLKALPIPFLHGLLAPETNTRVTAKSTRP